MDTANLVPGVVHCAKCGFELHRRILYAKNGAVGDGTSETSPCPNGCGPLWPVTWEQEAKKCWKRLEEIGQEVSALRTSQSPDQKAAEKRIRETMDYAEKTEKKCREILDFDTRLLSRSKDILQSMILVLQKAGHGFVNQVAWHNTDECDGCKALKEALEILG